MTHSMLSFRNNCSFNEIFICLFCVIRSFVVKVNNNVRIVISVHVWQAWCNTTLIGLRFRRIFLKVLNLATPQFSLAQIPEHTQGECHGKDKHDDYNDYDEDCIASAILLLTKSQHGKFLSVYLLLRFLLGALGVFNNETELSQFSLGCRTKEAPDNLITIQLNQDRLS